MAGVSMNGHHLAFCSTIVHRMPDNLVQDLIAHELAHVLQGKEGSFQEGDSLELEQCADDCVQMWGFDTYAIDEWLAEQGL